MATALFLALTLIASAAAPAPEGEPLPPGAPTGDYQLTAWCFGALGEYLDIYGKVKPDLVDIDRMFGSSVKNESQPYAADIAAMRVELKVFAGAIEAAEKASPQPIAPQGVEAMKVGQSIWRPAESKTRRELARAWLSWGLPDRCDVTARALAAKSALLGQALTYNATPSGPLQPAPAAGPAHADEPLVLKPIETPAPAANESSPGPAPAESTPEPKTLADAPIPTAAPALRGAEPIEPPATQTKLAAAPPPAPATEETTPASAPPQPVVATPPPAETTAATASVTPPAPTPAPPPATSPSDQPAEPVL
jgi:hypothetical protein